MLEREDGVITYQDPETQAVDSLSIEETIGAGVVRIWPGYFRGSKGEVVDDVEAYIAIKREPEFDVEAFRTKIEFCQRVAAAQDERERVSAFDEVLYLLPLKPQPTPEEQAVQVIIDKGYDSSAALTIAATLSTAGLLREDA